MAKFLKCQVCGNIVEVVKESGVPIQCCGQKMEELAANTTDAAQEKHVPAVTVDGDKVSVVVGSVEHPMLEEHFIQWIYLETENGIQKKNLVPGAAPKAEFLLNGEKPTAVYEYCNLHGLWKKEL
ncbi:MAG: desulfoferrodoxin family protein [Hespellia sp.]|nr:desulfoferrodoxin family protein [Hespellia sp.]